MADDWKIRTETPTPPKDGGPAFPFTVQRWNDTLETAAHGMSRRDWFAGQALVKFAEYISVKQSKETSKVIAGLCYELADAMIAESRRDPEPKP